MGTRTRKQLRQLSAEDHPHACGDKAEASDPARQTLGSSPRVWGQACLLAPLLSFLRIIPTRVGTRTLHTHSCPPSQDHPHACGDKSHLLRYNPFFAGSSPRVWGQELTFLMCLLIRGIIPTRVGTSRYALRCYLSFQDHPHACGDKRFIKHGEKFAVGSSPRVWGQVRISLQKA